MKKILLVLITFFVCINIAYCEVKHEYFGTVDEMVNKIKKLTPEQYATLRIFVQPSTRNTFGIMGSPYNIIHIK